MCCRHGWGGACGPSPSLPLPSAAVVDGSPVVPESARKPLGVGEVYEMPAVLVGCEGCSLLLCMGRYLLRSPPLWSGIPMDCMPGHGFPAFLVS